MEYENIYRDYLIQEITRQMEALREAFPEIEMKIYVNGEDTMEDEHGNLYIDALNHSFTFNYL